MYWYRFMKYEIDVFFLISSSNDLDCNKL